MGEGKNSVDSTEVEARNFKYFLFYRFDLESCKYFK